MPEFFYVDSISAQNAILQCVSLSLYPKTDVYAYGGFSE